MSATEAGARLALQRFQQQASERDLNFSTSALTPQHGAKGDQEALKRDERRSFSLRIPRY